MQLFWLIILNTLAWAWRPCLLFNVMKKEWWYYPKSFWLENDIWHASGVPWPARCNVNTHIMNYNKLAMWCIPIFLLETPQIYHEIKAIKKKLNISGRAKIKVSVMQLLTSVHIGQNVGLLPTLSVIGKVYSTLSTFKCQMAWETQSYHWGKFPMLM